MGFAGGTVYEWKIGGARAVACTAEGGRINGDRIRLPIAARGVSRKNLVQTRVVVGKESSTKGSFNDVLCRRALLHASGRVSCVPGVHLRQPLHGTARQRKGKNLNRLRYSKTTAIVDERTSATSHRRQRQEGIKKNRTSPVFWFGWQGLAVRVGTVSHRTMLIFLSYENHGIVTGYFAAYRFELHLVVSFTFFLVCNLLHTRCTDYEV